MFSNQCANHQNFTPHICLCWHDPYMSKVSCSCLLLGGGQGGQASLLDPSILNVFYAWMKSLEKYTGHLNNFPPFLGRNWRGDSLAAELFGARNFNYYSPPGIIITWWTSDIDMNVRMARKEQLFKPSRTFHGVGEKKQLVFSLDIWDSFTFSSSWFP